MSEAGFTGAPLALRGTGWREFYTPGTMRLLANTALALLGNALGLLVAAWALDGMTIDLGGFLIAVAIFTLVVAVSQPFLVSMSVRYARALTGSSALLAVLISLLVTSLVSRGLSIDGLTTWVLASVIVWVVSLVGALVLPLFLFKKALGREDRSG